MKLRLTLHAALATLLMAAALWLMPQAQAATVNTAPAKVTASTPSTPDTDQRLVWASGHTRSTNMA